MRTEAVNASEAARLLPRFSMCNKEKWTCGNWPTCAAVCSSVHVRFAGIVNAEQERILEVDVIVIVIGEMVLAKCVFRPRFRGVKTRQKKGFLIDFQFCLPKRFAQCTLSDF